MDQPRRIPMAWAQYGTKDIEIPASSGAGINEGRATWYDGFPEKTALPIKEGGIPPHYRDFQTVLYQITDHLCWQQAGGLYEFSTLDAYPPCAVVTYNNAAYMALTAVASNAAKPGTAGASNLWARIAPVDGSTLKVNGGGKAYVDTPKVADSLADGSTIVSNGNGQLAANLASIAASLAGSGLYAGAGKLNVSAAGGLTINGAGAVSVKVGPGLSVNGSGQLVTVSQGGGTVSSSLTLSVNGTAQWSFNGGTARTINVVGKNGITAGTSGGAVTLSLASGGYFPKDTVMLFRGTPPAGWTVEAGDAFNEAAIRVVRNSKGTTGAGGKNDSTFTKIFAAALGTTPTPTSGTVSAFKLGLNHIPSHVHTMIGAETARGIGKYCVDCGYEAIYAKPITFSTNAAGGGQAHSHGFKGATHNHSVNVAVKYVDAVFARKTTN